MKNTPEVPENTTSPGIKAKFVLLSLIGIFMFFVPVPSNGATTIPIEYLVSFLTGHFMAAGYYMRWQSFSSPLPCLS